MIDIELNGKDCESIPATTTRRELKLLNIKTDLEIGLETELVGQIDRIMVVKTKGISLF